MHDNFACNLSFSYFCHATYLLYLKTKFYCNSSTKTDKKWEKECVKSVKKSCLLFQFGMSVIEKIFYLLFCVLLSSYLLSPFTHSLTSVEFQLECLFFVTDIFLSLIFLLIFISTS